MDLKGVVDTLVGYRQLAKWSLPGPRAAVSGGKRHLLLLAWLFPPTISGGVYRPAALARYAARKGWRVTVICGPAPQQVSSAGKYLADYVGADVRTLRMTPSTLRPSHKLFPRIDGSLVDALATAEIAEATLRDDPSTVIVASGPPFHNFVAARFLSLRYGARFVLDYRDEWTECPFGFVRRGNADRFFEQSCLDAASATLFTTHSQREHALATFPMLRAERAHVVPNGWEPDDVASSGNAQSPLQPVGMRLAFVGALDNHTLPHELLAALGNILDRDAWLSSTTRYAFVGHKSRDALAALKAFRHPGNIELIDQVPKDVALAIMRQAHGVLLINQPDMRRYLPGKLYDYLAIGTPILVYGEGGEIARMVQTRDAGIVVSLGDEQALEAALVTLAERTRRSSVANDAFLAEHTRQFLAHRQLALLDALH